MADDLTTMLTPDFATSETTTTVGTPPSSVVYQCPGPGAHVDVQTVHVHDLLGAGWTMPQGVTPPDPPEPPVPASGTVPDGTETAVNPLLQAEAPDHAP
jgi:hypothetical protein